MVKHLMDACGAKFNPLIVLLTGMVALLVSCGRAATEPTVPVKTPVPRLGPTSEPASIISLSQTLVAGPGYLDECKKINAVKPSGQIPYKDVWPGKTRESELESLLGTPIARDKFNEVTNWVYDDAGLFIEDGVVADVLVPLEGVPGLTLKQTVLKYGCPDLIMAINTTQDQVGYTATRFIYLDLGIDFDFRGHPTTFLDVQQNVAYFEPANLQDYLEEHGWNVMGIFSGKPVDWEEAVR